MKTILMLLMAIGCTKNKPKEIEFKQPGDVGYFSILPKPIPFTGILIWDDRNREALDKKCEQPMDQDYAIVIIGPKCKVRFKMDMDGKVVK